MTPTTFGGGTDVKGISSTPAGDTGNRTRISIGRRTSRRYDDAVTVADALDFWAFAAGAANVVMQLSRRGVGYGVLESKVDSGNVLKHPWKRARTTFGYIAVAILGKPEDRAAFRAAVDVAHRQVRSGPASPVTYNAFDRDLQMWVAACLYVGLEDTYQLLRGELGSEQAEQFYRSGWTLGTTLQVSEDQWPPTRAEFDAYWDTASQQVAVDEVVARYLRDLVDLKMLNPLLRIPFRPLLRFLTAGFLAPVFRDALGMGWGDRRQCLFEWLFVVVAFANRFLPLFIRQGCSYLLLADVRRRIRTGRPLI